jgi:hypothetical protein
MLLGYIRLHTYSCSTKPMDYGIGVPIIRSAIGDILVYVPVVDTC